MWYRSANKLRASSLCQKFALENPSTPLKGSKEEDTAIGERRRRAVEVGAVKHLTGKTGGRTTRKRGGEVRTGETGKK